LLGCTAQGVGIIHCKDQKSNFEAIENYLNQYETNFLVIGNPVNMDGTIGQRAEIVQAFYRQFVDMHPQVEAVLWDERLSTKAAERALDEAGVKWKKRRDVVDKMAAQIILQSYLDYKSLRR